MDNKLTDEGEAELAAALHALFRGLDAEEARAVFDKFLGAVRERPSPEPGRLHRVMARFGWTYTPPPAVKQRVGEAGHHLVHGSHLVYFGAAAMGAHGVYAIAAGLIFVAMVIGFALKVDMGA
jgi:hypothetical protein